LDKRIFSASLLSLREYIGRCFIFRLYDGCGEDAPLCLSDMRASPTGLFFLPLYFGALLFVSSPFLCHTVFSPPFRAPRPPPCFFFLWTDGTFFGTLDPLSEGVHRQECCVALKNDCSPPRKAVLSPKKTVWIFLVFLDFPMIRPIHVIDS